MTTEIRSVACRFRHWKPEDEADILISCNVSLRYINSGSFRNVYEVDSLPLVVKVPCDDEGDGLGHSLDEIRAFRAIKKRAIFKGIRPYLPEVYFFDIETGVILMKQYKMFPDTRKMEALANEHGAIIGDIIKEHDWDFHTGNFAFDDTGRIVLIDLGLLGPHV